MRLPEGPAVARGAWAFWQTREAAQDAVGTGANVR